MHVYIGFDPREQDAAIVASQSLKEINPNATYHFIKLGYCRERYLYWRPMHRKDGILFDQISKAPCSTEFAITRFLVPHLAKIHNIQDQWVLFVDADILFRADLSELSGIADSKYAVQVVKHQIDHGVGTKMDGQVQTNYPRKNWSSVILWNLNHRSNKNLTLNMINTIPGRDLHAFSWLKDDEIGELPSEWNHLVGLYPKNPNAKIVHYTLGVPSMSGYENCEHSQEWWGYHHKNTR